MRLRALVCGWGLLLAGSTLAADGGDGGLRVSGFGTLAASHLSAPQGWLFLRDATQDGDDSRFGTAADSRLGLQLNYAPTRSLEFVGQVVAAQSSRYADDTDAVRWAFAAWRPNSDITLRVGRLSQSVYLMADYRDVGFAYLPVRPSVDFYGALPPMAEGADLERIWRLDTGRLRVRGQLFRSKGAAAGSGEAVVLGPAGGVIVAHEGDNGLLLRTSVTRIRTRNSTSAQPLVDALRGLAGLPSPTVAADAARLADGIDITGQNVTYLHLGAAQERANWQWSAEYAHVSGAPFAHFSSLYGLVGRRFGAVTLYAQASRVWSHDPFTPTPQWNSALTPILGPDAAAQIQQLGDAAALAANRSQWRQHTWSIGARWDLHDSLALKLQFDRMRMPENSNWLWGRSSYGAARASMATLALDFVF